MDIKKTNGIKSKEEILERLKKHLKSTLRYLTTLEKGGDEVSIPIENWYVHAHVKGSPEVAGYFSDSLATESKNLVIGWNRLIHECEKEAYFQCREVIEMNFPWFDELDLSGNLHKSLTVGEMAKRGARCMGLNRNGMDYVFLNTLELTQKKARPIYEKKRDLEERMIKYLQLT